IIQVAVDINHPFFFEHAYDHIPGMLFVEVGRQVGTAVSHLYYEVPHDVVFILKDITFNFINYGELNAPLFITSVISEKEYRKGQLVSMKHEGIFIQNGKEVAKMGGTWKIYDKKLIERMRNSSL
ncbi:AfsA-related hotdog domain-containing protein, partial [Bacteroidota bacterium]